MIIAAKSEVLKLYPIIGFVFALILKTKAKALPSAFERRAEHIKKNLSQKPHLHALLEHLKTLSIL